MNILTPFTIHRPWTVYTLTVLLFAAAVLSFRQDLMGKSPLDTPIPETEAVAVEAESLAVAAPTVIAVPPPTAVVAALRAPRRITPVPPEQIDPETLWLARVIYSETKRPEEQELVAWVVRNRVETSYRGKRTYQDVVLDPYQFSAFNPSSRKYRYYSNLNAAAKARGWQRALALAFYVRHAPTQLRPFSSTTRHFYSERSLPEDSDHPAWTRGLQPVTPERDLQLDAQRFRFYEGVM